MDEEELNCGVDGGASLGVHVGEALNFGGSVGSEEPEKCLL